MVWRFFLCDHSRQQSYVIVHTFYFESGEGGGRRDIELDRRAYTFKIISRHKLVDKNWALTENIYGFFSKIIRPVCARVFYNQQPDTNEPEELTKVKIRDFDYYVGLHHNDFIEKN